MTASQTVDSNYVLEWILIPYIRNLVLDHVKPEMFERSWQQNLVKSLSLFERDQEIELTLLLTKFLQVSAKPELESQERAAVTTIYNNHRVRVASLSSKSHDFERWSIEVNGYIAEIESFIKDKLIAKQLTSMVESNDTLKRKATYVALSEAANFTLTKEDDVNDFSDINRVLEAKKNDLPPDGKIYKSSFNLINMNATIGGYKYGDLIMVSARPGGGKTTALCQEGVFLALQNAKVMHFGFGDMTDFDIYCKYMSCFSTFVDSKNPISVINVYKNPEKYITPESIKFFNKIRIKAFPTESMTVFETVAKLTSLKKVFDFDVCIIDYDANMKAVKDSMYEEGGAQYKALSAFSQSQRVVQFIGSQIKPEYWDSELIPLSAANESSKKQHHIDYMLGIGWNKKFTYVGHANLSKIRRGISGPASKIYLDGAYSRLREIPGSTYDQLLDTHINGRKNDDSSNESSNNTRGPISL